MLMFSVLFVNLVLKSLEELLSPEHLRECLCNTAYAVLYLTFRCYKI